MKTIKITLPLERETKGTFLYAKRDDNAPITSLYIRKSAFVKGAKPPANIVITVSDNGIVED